MDEDILELVSALTLDVLGPIVERYSAPENPLVWVLTGRDTIIVHRYTVATTSWSMVDQFKLPVGLNVHNQYVVETMFYSATVDAVAGLFTPFRYDIIIGEAITYPPLKTIDDPAKPVIKPVVIGSDVYILMSDIRHDVGHMYKLIGEWPDWGWVQCSESNGRWLNSEVTVVAGKLYMPFTGEDDVYNFIEMYDPELDEWEVLPPVESDYVIALTTLHDELYVIIDAGEMDVYNIQRYVDGQWVTVTQYRAPENYAEIKMFGIGDLLYVKLEAVTIINVYNVMLDTWSVLNAPITDEDEVFAISTEYTTF